MPAALLDGIATGLTADGGATLSNGWAVKSDDFDNVFMVAAVITAPSVDEVAVWATNSLDTAALIFAVDGMAQEFSDWGDADKTGAAIRSSDHGVDEAKDCVR